MKKSLIFTSISIFNSQIKPQMLSTKYDRRIHCW